MIAVGGLLHKDEDSGEEGREKTGEGAEFLPGDQVYYEVNKGVDENLAGTHDDLASKRTVPQLIHDHDGANVQISESKENTTAAQGLTPEPGLSQ